MVFLKLITTALLLSLLFPPPAYCEGDHIAGKIAVMFKPNTKEEDAVGFVKKFNLEISARSGFEPASLHFNIENNSDAFIKEIQKEPLVSSAAEGEELELNGRKGRVVRVKFKQNAAQDKIEEISLKYRNRKGVIAWRYYRSKAPSMILKVPEDKELEWIKIFNGTEHKDIVDRAMLIGTGK